MPALNVGRCFGDFGVMFGRCLGYVWKIVERFWGDVLEFVKDCWKRLGICLGGCLGGLGEMFSFFAQT